MGLDKNRVTIFRGIPFQLGNFKLCWVEEKTSIEKQEVALPYQARIQEGILLANREEAYKLIQDITSLPHSQKKKR